MKKISYLFILLFVLTSSTFADATENNIAQVNFRDIEGLLTERAFFRPGNEALKKEHDLFTKRQAELQDKIQKSALSGSFNPMEFAKSHTQESMAQRKKYKEFAEAELLLIIEEVFQKKYALILKKTHEGSVLYTSIAIPDITQNIKQHLLKLKLKK